MLWELAQLIYEKHLPGTDELIWKQKLEEKCREQTYGYQGGSGGGGELGYWDWHIYTSMYKIANWWEPI